MPPPQGLICEVRPTSPWKDTPEPGFHGGNTQSLEEGKAEEHSFQLITSRCKVLLQKRCLPTSEPSADLPCLLPDHSIVKALAAAVLWQESGRRAISQMEQYGHTPDRKGAGRASCIPPVWSLVWTTSGWRFEGHMYPQTPLKQQ